MVVFPTGTTNILLLCYIGIQLEKNSTKMPTTV
uniref:Uncharacterized protein n=1 Tax=Anguilla anguilla TaxID=7936 RepID=A0A0E9PKH2_ANGAN